MYKTSSSPYRNTQKEMQIDMVYIVGGEWTERLKWKESVNSLYLHKYVYTYYLYLKMSHKSLLKGNNQQIISL